MSARITKKKSGKGQKDGAVSEPAADITHPPTIQIHNQPEVATLPPQPGQRRPAGVLKRTGPPPEGEQPAKKARLPKSPEVVGIDLDPVQGVSPMVGESSTEVPMATPIGTAGTQRARPMSATLRALKTGSQYLEILPREGVVEKSLSQLTGWKEFAYASCLGSMFMLPEFQKLQQQVDELKAALKDKESINQVSKNDLLRLNKKVLELGLQVNTANQKAEHEALKFKSLQMEKNKLEQKMAEVAAEAKASKESTMRAEEQAKKTELENQSLKEKIAEFESGSIVNQNIIDSVMGKFFSSEAWKDAQVDNFITFARDTVGRRHPELKEQLACIHYMAGRLTSTEKRELRAAGREVPPTPEPPTESDDDDDDDQDEVESRAGPEGKGKEVKEVEAKEAAGPSRRDEAAEPQQENEHVEVTSSEIFAGCESIGKAE